MNKVSIVMNVSYGDEYGKKTYLPMIYELNEACEKCYGVGFPRGYAYTDEPIDKMILTKTPRYLKRYVFNRYCSLRKINDFYSSFWETKMFDKFVASRLTRDNSDIIFTRANLCETIRVAKENGKKIIIFAADSEPKRQYERYIEECNKYGIKNIMAYGFAEFRDSYDYGYQNADKIVCISQISKKTYLDAGYKAENVKLIPLTGARFTVGIRKTKDTKKKAFICTAYHSLLKGTHRLLNAWKKANIKEIPLIIVGNLYGDMQEFIQKYGPYNNVLFVGNQSDLEEFYRTYDAVGVLLSFSEAAVRVTPEMMSMGFPMIVSPDATCDVVMDGYNGFVVDQTDENAVVDKLSYFANDWNRVHEMQKNVLKTVEKRSTVDFGKEVGDYLKTVKME